MVNKLVVVVVVGVTVGLWVSGRTVHGGEADVVGKGGKAGKMGEAAMSAALSWLLI